MIESDKNKKSDPDSDVGGEFKKQVDCSSHYEFSRYMEKPRWSSLWHQMDEILKVQPKTVLEIGKGTGILGALLKHYDIDYQSVDIDPELKPDHVASVTDLPFEDDSFDVVGCFQVLEHIPYEFFVQAVTELLRVARNRVVISLPDAKTLWPYGFHVPKKGIVWLHMPRPRLHTQKHVFDGEHYWEINKDGYPLSSVVSDIESYGIAVYKSYRVDNNPYHRFFILVK